MTENELAMAYALAVSAIPTELLSEEETFKCLFPSLTTRQRDRAHIGYVASCLRGDEYYDWIEPGGLIAFSFMRQDRNGIVRSIAKGSRGYVVTIETPEEIVRIPVERCRKQRAY